MPARHSRLHLLAERYGIVELAPSAEWPDWVRSGEIVSVTRTAKELSVLCPQSMTPAHLKAKRDYRGLEVEGPLDFDAVGILSSLLAPLAEAGVSILAVSTFRTDYIFVPEDRLPEAVAALRSAGHQVDEN